VLRFFGEQTLIQQTVDRLKGVIPRENVWVVTNKFLQAEIRKQLPEVPKEQVIAEPSQRNTAPCIALTAQILAEMDPDAVMGVFPADHLILKAARFRSFAKSAFRAAERGGGNHLRGRQCRTFQRREGLPLRHDPALSAGCSSMSLQALCVQPIFFALGGLD